MSRRRHFGQSSPSQFTENTSANPDELTLDNKAGSKKSVLKGCPWGCGE